MKTMLCVAGVAMVLAVAAPPSDGKRKMPPKTEICNKTKAKQYIATMSYAGRGRYSASGWTFIAPGECSTFQDDRYYIRGSAGVTGLSDEGQVPGCVKNTKRFDITAPRDELGDKARCDEEKGYLVEFRQPRAGDRKNTERVVIK